MERLTNILTAFAKFIEPTNVERLHYDFENFGSNPNEYFDGVVHKCSWLKDKEAYEVDLYRYNDVITISLNFETYAITQFNDLKIKLENELTHVTLNQPAEQRNLVLNNTLAEIEHLISLSTSRFKSLYPFVPTFFNDLTTYFTKKYNLGNPTNHQSVGLVKDYVKNVPKIKWLGNTNTLTTLLLQLNSGENNLGKQLVDCSRDDLRDLVLNNFLDKDGKEFSKTTINTYFDTNKSREKQAKKEVLYVPIIGDSDFAPQALPSEEYQVAVKEDKKRSG